jgi:hypothetical protein
MYDCAAFHLWKVRAPPSRACMHVPGMHARAGHAHARAGHACMHVPGMHARAGVPTITYPCALPHAGLRSARLNFHDEAAPQPAQGMISTPPNSCCPIPAAPTPCAHCTHDFNTSQFLLPNSCCSHTLRPLQAGRVTSQLPRRGAAAAQCHARRMLKPPIPACVLCCAVLRCAVLCCAVLCCAVLCPHRARHVPTSPTRRRSCAVPRVLCCAVM